MQLRERMERGQEGFQAGGARRYGEEEDGVKRRGPDHRRAKAGAPERIQNPHPCQGDKNLPIHDRLTDDGMQMGGGEEMTRGKGQATENRGNASRDLLLVWSRRAPPSRLHQPPLFLHMQRI